jgi:hypothetical protein
MGEMKNNIGVMELEFGIDWTVTFVGLFIGCQGILCVLLGNKLHIAKLIEDF